MARPPAAPGGPQLAPPSNASAATPARCPRAVTANRGYGQATIERDLRGAGVRTVAIPRQTTTSAARKAAGHGRAFRKLVKWRTGCEGSDQLPQTPLRLGPHRLDGTKGAAIWCGHGVFARNLVKIGTLAS